MDPSFGQQHGMPLPLANSGYGALQPVTPPGQSFSAQSAFRPQQPTFANHFPTYPGSAGHQYHQYHQEPAYPPQQHHDTNRQSQAETDSQLQAFFDEILNNSPSSSSSSSTTTTTSPATSPPHHKPSPFTPPQAPSPLPPTTPTHLGTSTLYPHYAALPPTDTFTSFTTARTHRHNQHPRDPTTARPTDPTLHFARAHPLHWIERLYEAFIDTSTVQDNAATPAWRRFVSGSTGSTTTSRARSQPRRQHYDQKMIVAVCWKLLRAVVSGCTWGFRRVVSAELGRRIREGGETWGSCAERLEGVCGALRREKTICVDVLEKGRREVLGFVYAPGAYGAMKRDYRRQNNGRGSKQQQQQQQVKREEEEGGGEGRRQLARPRHAVEGSVRRSPTAAAIRALLHHEQASPRGHDGETRGSAGAATEHEDHYVRGSGEAGHTGAAKAKKRKRSWPESHGDLPGDDDGLGSGARASKIRRTGGQAGESTAGVPAGLGMAMGCGGRRYGPPSRHCYPSHYHFARSGSCEGVVPRPSPRYAGAGTVGNGTNPMRGEGGGAHGLMVDNEGFSGRSDEACAFGTQYSAPVLPSSQQQQNSWPPATADPLDWPYLAPTEQQHNTSTNLPPATSSSTNPFTTTVSTSSADSSYPALSPPAFFGGVTFPSPATGTGGLCAGDDARPRGPGPASATAGDDDPISAFGAGEMAGRDAFGMVDDGDGGEARGGGGQQPRFW